MSELERLIEELCPDGVEYQPLGEVFDIRNGYTPSKSRDDYWSEGTLPWFRMEDIRQNGRILSDSIQHVSSEAIKGSLFPAYSLIVATSATIGEHALITVDSLANQRFSFLTRKEKYVARVNPYFAYYYCFVIDKWCLNNTNVSSFASVDMDGFRKLPIPIPPLPIQQEIVRILDAFTELEAELEARKRQYEYYCRQLIDNQIGVNVVRLRELGKWYGGGTPATQNRNFWESGTIPWISSKDMIGTTLIDTQDHITPEAVRESSTRLLPPNTVAVVVRSGILKHTLPIVFIPFAAAINQDIKALVPNSHVSAHYVAYALRAYHGDLLLTTKKAGGTVDSIDVDKFMNFPIPVPPLSEQARIVEILDRFDALTNDITQGLPAELAARRKQYEYYRDKLLSFKEKVS